jgi:hypothetical protein
MAGACDLLATTDTGTGTSVTFGSISQDYKHLEIQAVEQRSSSTYGNHFAIRFNGVTSSSYCDSYFTKGENSTGNLIQSNVSQSYGVLGWDCFAAWKPMCMSWYVWSDGNSSSYGAAGWSTVQIETNDAITSVTLYNTAGTSWDSDVTQFNLIGWGT